MAKKVVEQVAAKAAKVRFKKAEPLQKYFKCSVYGPAGSGKTFTSLTQAVGLAKACGKRILVIDTERGTDFLPARGFDFDAVYTKSLAKAVETIEQVDTDYYGVVIVDSISHLWQAAMDAYEGKLTKADGIPLNAWGSVKRPYKQLVTLLIDGDFHLFIVGRQKNMFDTGADGSLVKTGVCMQAEQSTEYEPHVCARMEAKKSKDDTSVSKYYAIYEKDRTGLLAGHTFVNPDFTTIECVIPLLTAKKQAKSEDISEVVAQDGELVEKDFEGKQTKSSDIIEACTELITNAKDWKAFAEAKEQANSKRRYLTHAHREELRDLFKNKEEKLATK